MASSTRFKKIVDYTDEELTNAVEEAKAHCGVRQIDFYTILKGVDAYMEKRNRKNAAEAAK